MTAVFAITASGLHLSFLSNKLISINVNHHVNINTSINNDKNQIYITLAVNK
ncbi:hypothetical protein wOo_02770 [Wolbachia endosymbiont of Onchocerca ochengi]|nr:hypothetical protein wOo_02770 [Wolbachia endosymbiont of Onchocerca ochengi]